MEAQPSRCGGRGEGEGEGDGEHDGRGGEGLLGREGTLFIHRKANTKYYNCYYGEGKGARGRGGLLGGL